MKRKIIKIDQEACTGCGDCIPSCPEGAIQIIDGKARLISDFFCDGLGACLGHCSVGAITIEERESLEYNEIKVMENIIKQGPNVIKAHLDHLHEHGETDFLNQAVSVLKQKGLQVPADFENEALNKSVNTGCPGTRNMNFQEQNNPADERKNKNAQDQSIKRVSELSHWPIQMHLISPQAPIFNNADILLCADCVAYAFGDFHRDYLKGKRLIIACPKLDKGLDIYEQKITALVDTAKIKNLSVMIMQVPCCSGLLHIAEQAVKKAKRDISVNCVVVGIKGQIVR